MGPEKKVAKIASIENSMRLFTLGAMDLTTRRPVVAIFDQGLLGNSVQVALLQITGFPSYDHDR
jgi:hypothetical protein